MSQYNPKAAQAVASSLLERSNPDPEDWNETVAQARVTELFESLERAGLQLSSMSETQVREHCMVLGLSNSQTGDAIEEWSSWAVTDDV